MTSPIYTIGLNKYVINVYIIEKILWNRVAQKKITHVVVKAGKIT